MVALQVALPVREEGGRKGDKHLQFLRCQRQLSRRRSVAAITSQQSTTVATPGQLSLTVATLSESSSKLLVATNLYALQVSLPAGEEGGREINTKPSLYCSQQSLSQRATP